MNDNVYNAWCYNQHLVLSSSNQPKNFFIKIFYRVYYYI